MLRGRNVTKFSRELIVIFFETMKGIDKE